MNTFSPSYNKVYLNDAMESLGAMFDYAVNDGGYEANDFFDRFVASGVARNIELGNPKFLAGMSGVETAQEVLRRTEPAHRPFRQRFREQRTPEYWMGWALSYLQWRTGASFSQLRSRKLGPTELLRLYPTMHEADLTKLEALAAERMNDDTGKTALQTIRKQRGLSQAQLAKASGVSLRMIQLYEQGQRDIRKAEAGTIAALADALRCDMQALIGP
jgi:DNA-binding transcriptional regulator YiaG